MELKSRKRNGLKVGTLAEVNIVKSEERKTLIGTEKKHVISI